MMATMVVAVAVSGSTSAINDGGSIRRGVVVAASSYDNF
jgi:hypothetical protein